jgi:hypothetical protein
VYGRIYRLDILAGFIFTVNVTQEFDEMLCPLQNVTSIWIPEKNHKRPLIRLPSDPVGTES